MANSSREELAEFAHNQWASWMYYLFSKGTDNADGSWTMPKEFVERWRRQAEMPYSELSESEKESDRNEADKFLAIIPPQARAQNHMRKLPKLSETYLDTPIRYAKCTHCHTLYIDDLPNYGSIFCPVCMLDAEDPLLVPTVIRGVTIMLTAPEKQRINADS